MEPVGEELERLARLRASGDITEAEFEVLKARVLEGVSAEEPDPPAIDQEADRQQTKEPATEPDEVEAPPELEIAIANDVSAEAQTGNEDLVLEPDESEPIEPSLGDSGSERTKPSWLSGRNVASCVILVAVVIVAMVLKSDSSRLESAGCKRASDSMPDGLEEWPEDWGSPDRWECTRVELEGADLSGSDLAGANLWEANLAGANLTEANLEGADLRGATLEGASLEGANFEGANLGGIKYSDDPGGPVSQLANLGGIKYSDDLEAYFVMANLKGASLEGANFEGALSWSYTIWPSGFNPEAAGVLMIGPGTDLSGADLSGVDLRNLHLFGANLAGADLTGAWLFGADLGWADLGWANLAGAGLSTANLAGANLTGANLAGANLYQANLAGADLTGADLTGASLLGANLVGADLTDVDLTDVSHGDGRLRMTTHWPVGFSPPTTTTRPPTATTASSGLVKVDFWPVVDESTCVSGGTGVMRCLVGVGKYAGDSVNCLSAGVMGWRCIAYVRD